MKLFSQTTGGFYDEELNGTNIPSDAVEIEDDDYAALLLGQSQGKRIVADNAGRPVLKDQTPPDLADVKISKSEEITELCLVAIDSGFAYQGHRYDSDLVSRTNIIGTATGVQADILLPEGFTWRTSDNENIPMDGAGVIALGAALLQHVNTQYATSWQLKAQVEAATTPEEVAAISWPTTP